MNPNFEKYLLGEMDTAEKARFEAELAQNPALHEQFEQERAFAEMLKNQMLRRRMEAALAGAGVAPASAPSARPDRRVWLALAFFVLLAAWLVRRQLSAEKNQTAPLPQGHAPKPTAETPSAAPLPPTGQGEKPLGEQPSERTKTPQNQPIAQAPSIQPHALQNRRGANPARTAWAEVVEKIWYAPLPASPENFGQLFYPAADLLSKEDFTGAFLLLRKIEKNEASNDTLLFLKGYCLMQIWEGREAMLNFEKLAHAPTTWQAELEWYTGLCHLVAGEKQEAVAAFEKVAAQRGHRYRAQAERASKLLR